MNKIYTSINKKNTMTKKNGQQFDLDDYYVDVQTYTQTNDKV